MAQVAAVLPQCYILSRVTSLLLKYQEVGFDGSLGPDCSAYISLFYFLISAALTTAMRRNHVSRIEIARQPPRQQRQTINLLTFRQTPVNARTNTDFSEFPNNECH